MPVLRMLSDAERAFAAIVLAALAVLSIYGYGLWQHHQGYEQHKAEVQAATEKKQKEQKNARKQADDDAGTDAAFIADYYYRAGRDAAGRVLPNRPTVQPCSCTSGDASGLLRPSEGSAQVVRDLRCEQESAQDAAHILRIQRYGREIGLKAGN